jgi:hypothetical protein
MSSADDDTQTTPIANAVHHYHYPQNDDNLHEILKLNNIKLTALQCLHFPCGQASLDPE